MGLHSQRRCDARDLRHGVRVRRRRRRQAAGPRGGTDRARQPAAIRGDAQATYGAARRAAIDREAGAEKHHKSCNKDRQAGSEEQHKACNKACSSTAIQGEKHLGKALRMELVPGGTRRARSENMTSDKTAANGHEPHTGGVRVKRGLAEMLKGGVIMDVVTPEQAKIAEDAGAVAVMALERVPSDIRRDGGVARMSDVGLIKEIIAAVTIPVMAKARIGHFVEAQVLQALGVDYIDESEVLTPADEEHHIDKWQFDVPFVCGARDLGEALRRIGEGAAMIRTKGEAGTGNVVEAVRHMRAVQGGIRRIASMRPEELMAEAKHLGAPFDLIQEIHRTGKLPVVNFSAGGIATPADAALMMQLGCDGNFVGSGIFKSTDPEAYAKAIVAATTYYDKPEVIAEVSAGLGKAMPGLDVASM